MGAPSYRGYFFKPLMHARYLYAALRKAIQSTPTVVPLYTIQLPQTQGTFSIAKTVYTLYIKKILFDNLGVN